MGLEGINWGEWVLLDIECWMLDVVKIVVEYWVGLSELVDIKVAVGMSRG